MGIADWAKTNNARFERSANDSQRRSRNRVMSAGGRLRRMEGANSRGIRLLPIRDPHSAIRIPRSSERATKVLEAIQALFDDIDAGGVAKTDRSIVTESCAGNYRDVRFT